MEGRAIAIDVLYMVAASLQRAPSKPQQYHSYMIPTVVRLLLKREDTES